MPLNCGVGEDSGESLGQQGDPTRSEERRVGKEWLTLFFGGAPKSLQMVTAAMK